MFAVLFAVRGLRGYWCWVATGYNHLYSTGANEWIPSSDYRNQAYLLSGGYCSTGIANARHDAIEHELLCQSPKIVNSGSHVTANTLIGAEPLSIYPNPFNPATVITVRSRTSAMPSTANVKIYDVDGKLIWTRFIAPIHSSSSSFIWNASNQPSGIYIVKATIGDKTVTKRISLLK
jgi:hypothetical protein